MVALPDEQLLELVRENERMRTCLRNIKAYAADSLFGVWRHRVYNMALEGLITRAN